MEYPDQLARLLEVAQKVMIENAPLVEDLGHEGGVMGSVEVKSLAEISPDFWYGPGINHDQESSSLKYSFLFIPLLSFTQMIITLRERTHPCT